MSATTSGQMIQSAEISSSTPQYTLVRITGKHDYRDVEPLYKNTKITTWIRDGRPWSDHKIYTYLDKFSGENYLDTGFVDYKIVVSGVTIGIVGFRLDADRFLRSPKDRFYKGRPFISILIEPNQQGKGYASSVLLTAMKEYNKSFPHQCDFYSYIRSDNQASIRAHAKAGFQNTRAATSADNHVLMTYSLATVTFETLYKQGYNKDGLINILTTWISEGNLKFPLSLTFLPESRVMMETFKKSTVNISNSPYDRFKSYQSKRDLFLPPMFSNNGTTAYVSIISDHYPEYQKINGLTDRYIEDQRIQSKKIDAPRSTAECWHDITPHWMYGKIWDF